MQDASPLPNAADAAALKALVPALVEACPDMYEMATRFAKKILADHAIDLDPEQVYWHRFHSSQSNPQTFTGWEHIEHPHGSMTLTQLVITRFTVHDQDNADMLDNDCGFYTAGPEAGTYDQTNEVKLYGSQVLKAFWAFNFADHFKTAAASFWSLQGDAFRTLAKCTFLAKAIEDREAGRLSDENFRTVVKATACNVSWPVTRQMLDESIQPSQALRIRRLKIGSYVASDILSIVDKDQRQILYVPGELYGFHVLNRAEDLHWWVLSQIEQPEHRKRFMAHFQVADHDIMEDTAALTTTQEWLLAAFPIADVLSKVFHEPKMENIGLNHLLDLLFNAWKNHDHSLLEGQDAWVADDPFTHLRDATHVRMLSDASYLMHSNGELRKKLWVGYLNAFGRTFGPLAAVGWPVALAVVGAGIANVGLNIDQAVNGKTATERKSGVTGAIFAAIDTLFNAMFLKTGAPLPDIAQAGDTVASEAQLEASLLEETEGPLLQAITPDRVPAVAEEESFLGSMRAKITEGTREGTGDRAGIIETFSGATYIHMCHGTLCDYFMVRYVKEAKGWLIVDPQNPWSFYRNLPVRLNAYKQWEPVASPGLKGGRPIFGFKPWGRSPSPLPEVETPATAYDVPADQKPILQKVADGNIGPKALDENYTGNAQFEDFRVLRRKLHNDARDFFLNPTQPPRPAIPAFAADTPPKTLFQRLLKDAPGVVIGENHSNVASKRLLIENMPLLAKLKVKTLYLEHVLTDFHQADLDVFHRTGKMPQNLERYLKQLDKGQGTDPTGQYTFLQVIKSAQENHLRVQAIDCLASYHSKGILSAEQNFRQKMMNYFAHTVIEADQTLRGPHKWVALVGDSHANTFEGVPGLSELEGTLGLRVEDSATGNASGVEPDPGRIALQMGRGPTTVKNDLRLQLEMPDHIRIANQLEQQLPLPGLYMRYTEQGQMLIVSRDRNDLIKCTPLQHDNAGYFVERPEWTAINGRRFKTLDDLNQALAARGMEEVVAPNPRLAQSASTATPSTRAVPTTYCANVLLEGERLNIQPGKFFHTYTLQPSGNLPSQAILMNEQAYYVSWQQDVNGPGHWAVVDPANPNDFNSAIPVRLGTGGEWEPIATAGLRGGADNPMPGPSSQPFSAYDVPRQALEETHIQIGVDANGQAFPISNSQRLINGARQRLLDDAQGFFRTPRTLPPRPRLPTMTTTLNGDTLIEQALEVEQASGLVVGEAPRGIGSKQFLIEHMPALNKARVKTLFIKGLVTEEHQADLNAFHRSARMAPDLRQSLEQVDLAQGNDPSGRFNLLELTRAAQANNIRVQALDCMASSPAHGNVLNDSYSRRWIDNYLAHRQIQRYVPGGSGERWVALVNPMMTNTYRELPGISELEGAVSLRIEDVPQGQGSGFMIDPGAPAPEEIVGDFTHPGHFVTTPLGPVTAYSDMRLQLETPWLSAGQKSYGEQFPAPGFYSLSNASGELKLIHRSRDRGLVYTPIQTSARGKLFIEAPSWPDIDRKPFDSVLDLMDALNARHMTLANWSKPLQAVP